MEIVIVGVLFTISILLSVGVILVGREIHKIRVLMEKSTREIENYMATIFEEEPPENVAIDEAPGEREGCLTNEEKMLLWKFDPEQLLTEVIGDIL